MNRRGWIGSSLLLLLVAGAAVGLAAWKSAALRREAAASASQPEPMETVRVAVASEREHVATTTSIGTVLALQSVTLRNELAGTVREVALVPGEIVEAGTLLVALDVAVEQAELDAQKARAALTETVLGRMQRALESRGASAVDVDKAKAERDVALAEVARFAAIIERKTIRAPFRARVGMADVHVGQYLDEGTRLTTLQGVDDAVHVDFTVAQGVAAALEVGTRVNVSVGRGEETVEGKIVAIDARVDPATRNAWVRAEIDGNAVLPGASVRVFVPVGSPRKAVTVPVSALRKGPGGDNVFVLEPDAAGELRARMRPVRSGAMLGDEVLILEGLSAGERVAASGSFKLHEGVRVVIADESAEASPASAASSAESSPVESSPFESNTEGQQ